MIPSGLFCVQAVLKIVDGHKYEYSAKREDDKK